jgi:hypothetical protein
MSLINDALKRAKLAQQQAPASSPPALQLRPLEPAPSQPGWRVPGLLLPVALAGVALFGLLFVWQLTHRSDSPKVVEAKTHVALAEDPPPAPLATAPASPAASQAAAQPNPPPQPVLSLPPRPAVAETAALSNATNNVEAANSVPPVTDVPPPSPPPLKLQAIIFNPRRPSALISGRTVFLGDKFGSLRVVGISRTSATLAGGGLTNVLSLPE